jgi:Mg2+ and Co2+ transporter CorA
VALPIVEIVTLANTMADVAGRLLKTYRERKRTPMPDAGSDPKDQLQALREHVQQLETTLEKQAELALQMSEQLQSLTLAVARQSRIARTTIIAACAALAAAAWVLLKYAG